MLEPTSATERDRVRAVVEDFLRAIGAKNVEQAVRHYAPECVQYSMTPPLQSIGPDAEALSAWFDTWQGPIGLESRDLAITTGQDVAFCTSLNRMRGTSIGGEKVDLWFRSTVGLRKIDGRWRIAHQHESVPFYMDGSFRAAVDLAP